MYLKKKQSSDHDGQEGESTLLEGQEAGESNEGGDNEKRSYREHKLLLEDDKVSLLGGSTNYRTEYN